MMPHLLWKMAARPKLKGETFDISIFFYITELGYEIIKAHLCSLLKPSPAGETILPRSKLYVYEVQPFYC